MARHNIGEVLVSIDCDDFEGNVYESYEDNEGGGRV